MQANFGDIYIINQDVAFSSFDYPKETVGQAGFSCSGASNDTNLDIQRQTKMEKLDTEFKQMHGMNQRCD